MYDKIEAPKNLIPTDPRFGCGPSLIPMRFIEDLAKTGPHLLGTSHRKSPVKNLCKSIRQNLTSYFGLKDGYSVVLGNGGATLLFDMIGLGAVVKSSHHFTCGEFSEKWYKSHKKIPWLNVTTSTGEYGHGITPTDKDGVDMLCMTLNETSTGVIMDKLPGKTKALVAVDATSGGGQVPCDVNQTDIYFFSPQKVFSSDGGLFIAILSPRARETILKIAEDKSRYIPEIMNWKQAIENSDKDQTYNTPAIVTLYMLSRQLEEMNKIGYQKVIDGANHKAKIIYDWAAEKSYLSPFVAEAKYRSNAVATIDVDAKVDVNELLSFLEKKKWVYGIDSYRKLERNQFRISLFHNIATEDVEKLTKLISFYIEKTI
jgi:phosphoserine aminotransferase